MQTHGFKWEDKPLNELLAEYPKCRAALRWWCNDFPNNEKGGPSRFNIEYNQFLKEFMIANPPKFRISNKCCKYAKKLVAEREKKCDILKHLSVRLTMNGDSLIRISMESHGMLVHQ